MISFAVEGAPYANSATLKRPKVRIRFMKGSLSSRRHWRERGLFARFGPAMAPRFFAISAPIAQALRRNDCLVEQLLRDVSRESRSTSDRGRPWDTAGPSLPTCGPAHALRR